ncbi:hypothetical protein [Streptomyces sp. NPDC046909]|uniref:hypothetical protein n=1 Tax=Streptomyces sp. NPDC046909 TaxID=3155617 RepID=UPI0033C13EAA
MSSREIREHDEAVDDVEAASLGRSRMADGRRIELSVGELARLVDAGADGSLGVSRCQRASLSGKPRAHANSTRDHEA